MVGCSKAVAWVAVVMGNLCGGWCRQVAMSCERGRAQAEEAKVVGEGGEACVVKPAGR